MLGFGLLPARLPGDPGNSGIPAGSEGKAISVTATIDPCLSPVSEVRTFVRDTILPGHNSVPAFA